MIGSNNTILQPLVAKENTLVGVCAVCPNIIVKDHRFCFTGASKEYSRKEFKKTVESLGGTSTDSLSPSVDYLVIGASGNPCWAYACYGRKVEMAVKLRKEGHKIILVHEYDFHNVIPASK